MGLEYQCFVALQVHNKMSGYFSEHKQSAEVQTKLKWCKFFLHFNFSRLKYQSPKILHNLRPESLDQSVLTYLTTLTFSPNSCETFCLKASAPATCVVWASTWWLYDGETFFCCRGVTSCTSGIKSVNYKNHNDTARICYMCLGRSKTLINMARLKHLCSYVPYQMP